MMPLKVDAGSESLSEAMRARQGLLPLNQIHPRADQPRSQYDHDSLEDLKDSIRAHGILEPLVVRPMGDEFEIVCGERRYRAAKDLGLAYVPVRSIDVDSDRAFLVAIHENVHRDNLTPIDEARAYQRIMDSGQAKSQRHLARLVNVSQARVSQRLALLKMPEDVVRLLSIPGCEFTERHARVLRQLPTPEEQIALVRRIVEEKLTVDQTCALIETGAPKAGRSGSGHRAWFGEAGVRYRTSKRGLEVRLAVTGLPDQIRALRELAERLEASGLSPSRSSTENP